jgi:hypothetical protein
MGYLNAVACSRCGMKRRALEGGLSHMRVNDIGANMVDLSMAEDGGTENAVPVSGPSNENTLAESSKVDEAIRKWRELQTSLNDVGIESLDPSLMPVCW